MQLKPPPLPVTQKKRTSTARYLAGAAVGLVSILMFYGIIQAAFSSGTPVTPTETPTVIPSATFTPTNTFTVIPTETSTEVPTITLTLTLAPTRTLLPTLTRTPRPTTVPQPTAVPQPTSPPNESSLGSAPVVNPTGATAQCRDGTLSYSAHRKGTCSHHGGVAVWY